MGKAFHFLWCTVDDIELIPSDTPRSYRWWIPRLHLAQAAKRLYEATEEAPVDVETPQMHEALEGYKAARFGCRYGRPGSAALRRLIEEAEAQGIGSRTELRSLVERGNIGTASGGEVELERRWLVPPVVISYWGAIGVATAVTMGLVLLHPMSHAERAVLGSIVAGAFVLWGSAVQHWIVRHRRRAGRLVPRLAAFHAAHTLRHSRPDLTLGR